METNKKYIKFFGLLVIVLAVLCVALNNRSDLPKGLSSKWQAVFLTDGQVYFGKLDDYNNKYVKLTDVYYLKFSNGLQQEKDGVTSISGRNLNLIKLGGEAHGPEGEMYISKSQIMFFENLKESSTVVQAILGNKK